LQVSWGVTELVDDEGAPRDERKGIEEVFHADFIAKLNRELMRAFLVKQETS
jgi:hypothetical protein